MSAQTYTGELVVIEPTCCHVPFGMSESLYREATRTNRWWWCPSCGSHRHFTGASEEEKLRRRLANEQENTRAARADAALMANRLRGTKGALTKARKRAAAGVCPCCKRQFQNVVPHMSTQHPSYDPTEGSRA